MMKKRRKKLVREVEYYYKYRLRECQNEENFRVDALLSFVREKKD